MLHQHANAQLSIVSLDIVSCAGLDTLYTRAGEFRTLTFCKDQSWYQVLSQFHIARRRTVYVPEVLILSTA